jgi:hypothetical protein
MEVATTIARILRLKAEGIAPEPRLQADAALTSRRTIAPFR